MNYAVVLQLTRDEGLGDDRITDSHPHTQDSLHRNQVFECSDVAGDGLRRQ